MLGKQKAVTGETELSLTFLQNSVLGANGKNFWYQWSSTKNSLVQFEISTQCQILFSQKDYRPGIYFPKLETPIVCCFNLNRARQQLNLQGAFCFSYETSYTPKTKTKQFYNCKTEAMSCIFFNLLIPTYALILL